MKLTKSLRIQIFNKKDVILIGENGHLDSLSYLNFAIAVEQKVNEVFGKNIFSLNMNFLILKTTHFIILKI